MKKTFKFFSSVILIIASFHCATTRIVRPLEEKQIKVGLDLLGPMVTLPNSSVPIPIPLSSVSFAYGIHKNITFSAATYITEALFGVIHLDTGATFGIFSPMGIVPGLSVSPTLAWMVDTWEGNFKFYPIVDLNVYWNIAPRNDILYLGLSNWFETTTIRADGNPQPNIWLPTINLGYTFALEKWTLTVEVKYLGFNLNSQKLAVNYFAPGTNGTLGIYLATARLF